MNKKWKSLKKRQVSEGQTKWDVAGRNGRSSGLMVVGLDCKERSTYKYHLLPSFGGNGLASWMVWWKESLGLS